MKSSTLPIYKNWLKDANPKDIAFVDDVYKLCEDNYEGGGDNVVECMSPIDVLEEFKDLEAVKEYCGLHVEQALNQRWGGDDDPQLKTAENFDNWK